ncbi:MAG: T9SS type A sorting domain-containing protein [Salibacteraceae bacterium]
MKKILLFLFSIINLGLFGQFTATKKTVVISNKSVVNPMDKPSQFAPILKNLEAPIPGGNALKDFINSQKIKSAQLFPAPNRRGTSVDFGQSPDPVIMSEMNMRSYIAQIDKEGIYNGGTPLDNTMCLGKDHLLASVNSFLWAYDITGDSNLFVDENGSTYNISFAEFGKDFITDPGTEFPFDPKLAYIPKHDKYVFIYLSGRTPSDSKIIVGFSSTNDPRDPWNVYMLPGNPRNLDQWTDFPMFGFDDNDIYLSINLLKANTSWQLGFEGSIIWQVPMEEGFTGQTLNTTMYDDILFEGTKIRNLTPVQPGDLQTQNESGITFLSNRNFDIQNDSLFIIEINAQKELTVSTKQLPTFYGMPPNGIQADDNPNDLTDGLQTNDARFLGVTKYINSANERYIEFVGNTKDFSTGRAGIFHGIMRDDLIDSSFIVSANIIGVDSLDFGYPNIAYVHNGTGCYEGTLIAFNHTAFATNAGVSAIRHSNTQGESGYSNIIRLKEGDGHVRRLSGSYERWGDYFGIQSVPGHPNEVYTAGFYGTDKNSSSTWFNRIKVTDSNHFIVTNTTSRDEYMYSTILIEINAELGYKPYNYLWQDGSTQSARIINSAKDETYTITVNDSKGCTRIENINITSNNLPATLYPNPVVDELNVFFESNKNVDGSFIIYDMTGKQMANLGVLKILEGNNQFTMSTRPLAKGSYVLMITDSDNNTISQNSFVKL